MENGSRLEDGPRALHQQDDDEDDADQDTDQELAHDASMRSAHIHSRASRSGSDCSFLACDHAAVHSEEILISVDIEASGPSPSTGNLLSLGACLVDDPSVGIYLELRPEPGRRWDEEAAQVHGLTRDRLEREGLAPPVAMEQLAAWVERVSDGGQPVFVGFNAPFDWMFVADCLWRHIGRNPFGVAALDLKSYAMGRDRLNAWAETRRIAIDERLGLARDHTHHALEDAQGQARLARVLMGLD